MRVVIILLCASVVWSFFFFSMLLARDRTASLYYIRKVRSRNFPSGGDFPGIIWSVSIASGIVLLGYTLSRGFQARENSTPQVVGGKLVMGQNAFQVRFKLFQVRDASGLKSDGCECPPNPARVNP